MAVLEYAAKLWLMVKKFLLQVDFISIVKIYSKPQFRFDVYAIWLPTAVGYLTKQLLSFSGYLVAS